MIYLDSAATSLLKPDCVYEAVVEAMKGAGNAGRGASRPTLTANRILFGARMAVSKLVYKGHPDRVILTSGATDSLNTVINSLGRGDHAITTFWEHNSVLRPLYLAKKRGCELSIIDPEDHLESFIQENTNMIITTQASNVTGNVVDVQKIGKIAKKNGIIYVVDASQSIGHIDIDMDRDCIDILCFSGHKGVMAPQGTGALVLKEGIELEPVRVGGSGFDSFSKEHPKKIPEALEAGTLNSHGFAGLSAGINYLEENPNNKTEKLYETFLSKVRNISNIILYGDVDAKKHVPVLSLNVKGISAATIADELEERGAIAVRAGAHCAPLMHINMGTKEQGAVRFSFSEFNTMEEIEVAANTLLEIASEY